MELFDTTVYLFIDEVYIYITFSFASSIIILYTFFFLVEDTDTLEESFGFTVQESTGDSREEPDLTPEDEERLIMLLKRP